MTAGEVTALLQAAVAAGQAFPTILAWAKQTHPQLRTEPLPELDEVDTAREAALRRSGR